jgi:hypothetical protein
MINNKFFNRLATTVAIAGMMFTGIADLAAAATKLNNGEASGFIRTNSPSFRYRNQSQPGTPVQRALGEEYTFTAQQGDPLDIAVEVEEGSNLQPVLVLISSQTGRQVAYNNTTNSLQYTVPTAGEYRLLVLGQNNTRGRYNLFVSGLGEGAQVSQADRIMTDVLQLRTVGCGVPNVATITIGNEQRCTRDIASGQYVYQESTRSLKAVNATREILARELQLTILDQCPTAVGRPVVRISVTEPQVATTSTYCANPTRFIQAGNYTYNIQTDEFQPVGTAQNPSSSPTSQTTDQRKQFLLNEYGLRLLNSCPQVRTNVVEVTFPEGTYCATPNRLITAGKYTYNAATGEIDPAEKPQQCTFRVAGICVVP